MEPQRSMGVLLPPPPSGKPPINCRHLPSQSFGIMRKFAKVNVIERISGPTIPTAGMMGRRLGVETTCPRPAVLCPRPGLGRKVETNNLSTAADAVLLGEGVENVKPEVSSLTSVRQHLPVRESTGDVAHVFPVCIAAIFIRHPGISLGNRPRAVTALDAHPIHTTRTPRGDGPRGC